VSYLEQLAEWVSDHGVLIGGRAEWERRLSAFESELVVVDITTEPYTVTSAPERGTPEFAEWWDRAIAECWWLQDHPEWSTCGEVNMGWYFQILGGLVGIEILYPYRNYFQNLNS